MNNMLFTITGCNRCKIVKRFMKERDIPYLEKNIREDGKEDFQKFYAANRKAIYRGPGGIEFPVFFDGTEIRQGLGHVIAYLMAGKKLDGFVHIGVLHQEWVDGLHVSGGNMAHAQQFLQLLRFLKSINMKLQLETNGKNSGLLEQILHEQLADKVIMDIKGPMALYSWILGETVDTQDIEKSIALVPRFPQYRFQTTITPFTAREAGGPVTRYPTPGEIAETAKLVKEVTGSKKHPYFIRLAKPQKAFNQETEALKPLQASDLLKYRTAARAYLVHADLEKN